MKAIDFYRGSSSMWIRAATMTKGNAIYITFSREGEDGKHDKKSAVPIALEYVDVIRIIEAIKSDLPDVKITHKYASKSGESVTTLTVQPGKTAGTYLWSISRKLSDTVSNAGIYIDSVEMVAIRVYLEKSLDFLLADARKEE